LHPAQAPLPRRSKALAGFGEGAAQLFQLLLERSHLAGDSPVASNTATRIERASTCTRWSV